MNSRTLVIREHRRNRHISGYPNLYKEEVDSLKRPITSNKIERVNYNSSKYKCAGGFTGELNIQIRTTNYP